MRPSRANSPTPPAARLRFRMAQVDNAPQPIVGNFLGHQLSLEVDYPNWGTVYAGPETLTVGQASQFNDVSPCPAGCAAVTGRVGANTLDFSWGTAGTWPKADASAMCGPLDLGRLPSNPRR
jgi:hypothetical protein